MIDAKPGSVELPRGLTVSELVARYRAGVEALDRRVFSLDDAQLDMAYLPDAGLGRWPIRVVLGHVADADVVYTHRMRRIVAEERPILGEWDENAFVDSGVYGVEGAERPMPPGAIVAAVHALRQWTGLWLETLNDAATQRQGLHPSYGPQSVVDVLRYATWHLEHHAAFVNAKVARWLGPADGR